MSAWLVKVLHTAAIAFWVGGLIAMPLLLMERWRRPDEALERLHRTSRFLHVGVVSPAAFIAIASGIALIFLYETWEAWFTVKLALVGLLAGIHMLMGVGVIGVFEKRVQSGWLLPSAMIATTLILAFGILAVVLAEPDIPPLSGMEFEAGALGEVLGPVVDPILNRLIP